MLLEKPGHKMPQGRQRAGSGAGPLQHRLPPTVPGAPLRLRHRWLQAVGGRQDAHQQVPAPLVAGQGGLGGPDRVQQGRWWASARAWWRVWRGSRSAGPGPHPGPARRRETQRMGTRHWTSSSPVRTPAGAVRHRHHRQQPGFVERDDIAECRALMLPLCRWDDLQAAQCQPGRPCRCVPDDDHNRVAVARCHQRRRPASGPAALRPAGRASALTRTFMPVPWVRPTLLPSAAQASTDLGN